MAACSTSGRTVPPLQRSSSAPGPKRRLSGHRRATCTRALSQGWEDDFSDLHSDLQRAIADMKAHDGNLRAASPGRRLSDSWDLDDQPSSDLTFPWPPHLPASGAGGQQQQQQPLEFYPTGATSRFDLDWGVVEEAGPGSSAPAREAGSHIFVILFGVGQADTEGIYSLRAMAKDDGLPVDTIVAFENMDDAQRYACLLEATMDHEPTVWPIEWGELLDFCNSAGYRCRLEPPGSLLIPPDYNVGMTDWEKSLRLRNGEFAVLDAEPEPACAAGLFSPSPHAQLELDWALGAPAFAALDGSLEEEELPASEQVNVVDSQLADPVQLAALKAQLESLLPRD